MGVRLCGERTRDRELSAAELARLGYAVRHARADRLDVENRDLASRLGLAA